MQQRSRRCWWTGAEHGRADAAARIVGATASAVAILAEQRHAVLQGPAVMARIRSVSAISAARSGRATGVRIGCGFRSRDRRCRFALRFSSVMTRASRLPTNTGDGPSPACRGGRTGKDSLPIVFVPLRNWDSGAVLQPLASSLCPVHGGLVIRLPRLIVVCGLALLGSEMADDLFDCCETSTFRIRRAVSTGILVAGRTCPWPYPRVDLVGG